ncbi:MAG TPA: DsrE family protein [Thermoleophilia bacterium]|jgi:sulfur relay (sulfurtransferase) complex TusBCD TusD component (DsrE family)|nr:DsrE family protein [Thermoleophilia bacterium]
MSTLLVVNGAPYGSEAPYNAFRLAEALALRDEVVEVFLMGDAVHAARAGQDPQAAHASLEGLLTGLLERGVEVTCCGTCCRARGVAEDDLVEGVRLATIHDLAEAVARCGAHLSF